jgi:hypothetical protein
MVVYSKRDDGSGGWELHDANGRIGRVWSSAHIDRIIRDSDLAEQVSAIINQPTVTRRTSARAAYNVWLTAGGRSVDFSAFTQSTNNDAGIPDGNKHVYIAGAAIGYLHGDNQVTRDSRLARFVRLAEEIWSAEQIASIGQRNAALDAALDRFRDAGALT